MVADISIAPGELPLASGEPERVYHYTDAGGLYGIVTGKCLWASDVWFMNDAREARYGLDVIERELDSLTLDPGPKTGVRTKVLRLLHSFGDQEDTPRSYIACLSKVDDDLSQWRAYGGARGFSIGFDVARLRHLCSLTADFGKPTYREAAYDETLQHRTVSVGFNTAVEGLSGASTDDELHQAAVSFISFVLQLSPAFKHPAFESEREIRLHVFHPPTADATSALHFRTGAMGIVPYIEIDLREPGTDEMPVIREVVIGPQANERESQRAVRQLLVRCGLPDVDVRLSKVPLRPQ